MKKICVLFSIITIATASLNTETDNLLSTALKFVRDCGDKSMLLCAKVSKFQIQKWPIKTDKIYNILTY